MVRMAFLVAASFLASIAVAAEAPLKASEADLLTKLFQMSLADEDGHSHVAEPAEELSEVEYKAICRDLEDISGIEISRNNTRVRIVGEIVDVNDWSRYSQVVHRYGDLVADYVVFRPGPALIESLKKLIVSLGFEVAEKASHQKPGVVAFTYESNILRIEGWFLSKADIDDVLAALATQTWLSTDFKAADGRVPCELRLKVVDRLIDVGVVFVRVSKSESEAFGNMVADGKILDFQTIGQFSKMLSDFVPSLTGDENGEGNGGYVRVESGMKAVVYACAENSIGVDRASGHATLNTNDMDKRAKFLKGGNMILKVAGQMSGATIQQVQYGFSIECLGKFIRKDELSLDLKLQRSSKPEKEGKSTDYSQSMINLDTHVACRLGQTVILAGSHEVGDAMTGPNGYAFLRKIPVLGWFFSGGSEDRKDEHFLILVSPTLLEESVRLSEKPSAENATIEDTTKPLLKKDVEDDIGISRWYEVFYFWKWGF